MANAEEYVFLDANALIYYGKAQYLSGNPVLDRLYVPNRPLVITTTVQLEATGGGNYPDQAVIAKWIQAGVRDGKIIVEPTPTYSGKGAGEKSIIHMLGDDFYNSHAARIISDNYSDFTSGPSIQIDSAQQYMLESLFNGGSSIAEYVVDSNWLADSAVNAGPPLLSPGMMISGPLHGLQNGVTVEFITGGGVVVTDARGVPHAFGPFDRFDIDLDGTVEKVATVIPTSLCFAAGTLVSMADGSQMPIERVQPGDVVLAFDPSENFGRGALVPKRVVRLFQNDTEEWLQLVWHERGQDRELTVTPGHRFLDAEGQFRRIDQIITDPSPTVVLADGSLVQVNAKRIVWSEQTRHLFEEAEAVAMAAGDGLAHYGRGAWRSYNFEVEDLHTYVAGGVRVHNDSQATIDLAGSLGRAFGTQLGLALTADESQFVRLAAGTALGVVSQNLAEVITDTGFHLFDGSQLNFGASLGTALRQLEDLPADLLTGVSGGAVSLLVAELGEKLGLEGFGADLFNLTASTYAGSVLDQVALNVSKNKAAFASVDWSSPWEGFGSTIGSFFGSSLARKIMPATSIEGSVGGSLGSIVGTSIGVSALANNTLGLVGNILLPGVGAFIGTLLGTFLGSLFADEPDPRAVLDLFADQQGTSIIPGHNNFFVTWTAYDGFPEKTTQQIGLAVRDLTQEYLKNLEAIELANAHIDNFSLSKSHQGLLGLPAQPLVRVLQKMSIDVASNGALKYFVNGTQVSSAEKMVDGAMIAYLKDAQPIGGDLMIKRAVARSTATDSITLASHMAAAEEYKKYLSEREAINALIASEPRSVFAATWAINLAQAEELKLRALHPTDYNGGLQGFLQSLSVAGLSVTPSDITVSKATGGRAIIEIAVADRENIPDFSRFLANGLEIINTAGGGARLRLFYNGNMASEGFTDVTGRVANGARFDVTGETAGRDFWIAPDNSSYTFQDIGTGRIKVGQAEIEASDDILIARGGNDALHGGTGWDWMDGGAGNDELRGGEGNDVLLGGAGNDRLFGMQGQDYIEGGAGADTISGGGHQAAGASVAGIHLDTAGYTKSPAAVHINLNAKTAAGGDAAGDKLDLIINLVGSRFNDTLIGDANRNDLEGGAGADILDGGPGTTYRDFASYYRSSKGVTASLAAPAQNTGDAKGDVYRNIEGLRGSALDDTLIGNAAANSLWGEGGDDVLIAGAGADEILGGFGFDILSYRHTAQAVTINVGNWAASSAIVKDETVFDIEGYEGTNHNDTLIGSNNADVLIGGGGNDMLTGLAGNDALVGGAGNDILHGQAGDDVLTGSEGNDILVGGLGKDRLDGGAGIDRAQYHAATAGVTVDLAAPKQNKGEAAGDTFFGIENIHGSEHADALAGDALANTIWGAGGNDRLIGRAGNDILLGGAGADDFQFARNYDRDTVNDFENNVDELLIHKNLGVSTVAQVIAKGVQSGADVLFNFGLDDILVVKNMTLAALQDDIVLI